MTDEMVARGSDWWKRWAGADEDGSFSPYEQLAAAFAAAGHNQGADDFRYYKYVLQDVESPSILSWPLRAIGGYGLRSYAARPLYWAFGLSLLGAVYLRFRVKGVSDAGHGLLWCLGASANQLLPSVINIKKEFKDFFDDPEKNQFTPWQDFVFVLFALSGLVIGGFVVAALTALGHAP